MRKNAINDLSIFYKEVQMCFAKYYKQTIQIKQLNHGVFNEKK